MSSPPAAKRRKTSFVSSRPITGSSSYQAILEHVLTYPGTYPLPSIVTMPSSPAGHRRPQPLPSQWSTPKSATSAARPDHADLPQTPTPQQTANAQLVTSLEQHIGNSPSQPCSLPPSFTVSFLRRCFPVELHLVDFPQALTGLDYLEDLNARRRRDISNAKRRLGVADRVNSTASPAPPLSPGISTWLRDVENSERKAEALYTQLYVALRRWIIINELSLEPYNDHNALAMINILYPTSRCTSGTTMPTNIPAPPPSTKLTPQVLSNQRAVFLKYVTAVLTKGTAVLKPLMDQGKPSSSVPDETGWPSVAVTLDSFLRVALRAIDDATAVQSREDLELPRTSPPRGEKKKRKADSGISVGGGGFPFGALTRTLSSARSPTSPTGALARKRSTSALTALPMVRPDPPRRTTAGKDKSLPPSPAGSATGAPKTVVATKNFSRLERIAIEVRRIRQNRRALAADASGSDSRGTTEPLRGGSTDCSESESGDNLHNEEIARELKPYDSGSTPKGMQPDRSSGTYTTASDGSGYKHVDNLSINGGEGTKLNVDLGSTTTAVTSIDPTPSPEPPKQKSIKRLRSFGDLKKYAANIRSRSSSRAPTARSDEGGFDGEEMKRQRAIFEAKNRSRAREVDQIVV